MRDVDAVADGDDGVAGHDVGGDVEIEALDFDFVGAGINDAQIGVHGGLAEWPRFAARRFGSKKKN